MESQSTFTELERRRGGEWVGVHHLQGKGVWEFDTIRDMLWVNGDEGVGRLMR